MKYALTLLSLFLVSCSQPSPKTIAVVPEKPIDTSKYAILKYDKERDKYEFANGYRPAELSYANIITLEMIIAKKAKEYNENEENRWRKINKQLDKKKFPNEVVFTDTIAHPENYFKQLIAVTNSKGEKIVRVNCFCDKSDKSGWKKDVPLVMDGGACYFQLEYNLTTNTIIGFWVNGVA